MSPSFVTANNSAQAASGTASPSGNFVDISAFADIVDRVTNLESETASITGNNATISGTLSVTGRTLLTDVGITGNLNVGVLSINGLNEKGYASINSSGPIEFQSLGLGGVDFLGGKVTIDTTGNVKVKNNLDIGGDLNIDGAITITARAGEGIKAGDALYISGNGIVNKADSSDINRALVIGIAVNNANANGVVKVAVGGKIKGLANLQAGRRYFLGTNGTIVTPTPAVAKQVPVGVAFSDKELIIQIQN